MQEGQRRGQRELDEKVVKAKFCTACGACVNVCPYRRARRDRIVTLFDCDIVQGRCYAFCPRTGVDLDGLAGSLFDPADLTVELGAVKGIFLARAAGERVRMTSQHGGTVTALAAYALRSSMVDGFVLTQPDASLVPRGELVTDWRKVRACSGSTFVASPSVAAFNMAARGPLSSIGAVALPCHALAYAKMRAMPEDVEPQPVGRPALVIGLFCSWALAWEGLFGIVSSKVGAHEVTGMEIPPKEHGVMQVFTREGMETFGLEDVKRRIRGACHYCFDLTSEFADISVGSALLEEDWETARRWNLLIVRSARGLELVENARRRRAVDVREAPENVVAVLKEASVLKRARALRNLRLRSQEPGDFVYLNTRDPYLAGVPGS